MTEELRERLEGIKWITAKATKGPFWYDGCNYIFAKHPEIGDAMIAEIRGAGSGFDLDANAHLIAALLNNFPLLVSEVERLEARIRELEAEQAPAPVPTTDE